MKPQKIIIATVMLLAAFSALNGCTPEQTAKENGTLHSVAQAFNQLAKEVQKDVSLKLDYKRDGTDVVVSVFLENPKGKNITSVQSWLAFNPRDLQGKDIMVTDSAFDLAEPRTEIFDAEKGLVMLGRASTKGVSDTVLKVADIRFRANGDVMTLVDAYDYRTDLSGHCSANIVYQGTPYNILLKPSNPALVIQ
jgi:hypothetical protein